MAPRYSRRNLLSASIAAADADEACSDDLSAVGYPTWEWRKATISGKALKGEQVADVVDDQWKHWNLEDADGGSSEASSCSAEWFAETAEGADSDSIASISSAATSCSFPSIDSMADYYSREETIIIFDWDDTLCPSTTLNAALARAASAEEYDEDPLDQSSDTALKELAAEARRTLEMAQAVAAEVVIVTNATEGWVESSCESWLPGLRPTLELVQVESARSTWEPTGIVSPTEWKAATFEQLVRKFYSRYWQQSWKNVIVIGDACYEHEALGIVAGLAPQGPGMRCRAKSVRFSPHPTVDLLACELKVLRESFEDIVHYDDNLEMNIFTESL